MILFISTVGLTDLLLGLIAICSLATVQIMYDKLSLVFSHLFNISSTAVSNDWFLLV